MKVFGIILPVVPSDNISARQCRAVVAAKTKKAAAELFGVSYGEFANYGCETGNALEIDTAMATPNQVFARSVDDYSGPYVEISRRPHVPFRRVKKQYAPVFDYTRMDEVPAFTHEELTTILERFAMSNDPIGQSIATKAEKMLGSDI